MSRSAFHIRCPEVTPSFGHIDIELAADSLKYGCCNKPDDSALQYVHSDRGSQYTSKCFRDLLESYGIRSSMGDVGACWYNAVVERFFGSLKHDWIFKVAQPTRDHMKSDVAAYIKYYNLDRLHTANGGVSPIHFEESQKKVSGFA